MTPARRGLEGAPGAHVHDTPFAFAATTGTDAARQTALPFWVFNRAIRHRLGQT